jgi:hypothetical protein
MLYGRDGQNMWQVWSRGEMCTDFRQVNFEGRRPLGISKRRCEYNIKVDLKVVQ